MSRRILLSLTAMLVLAACGQVEDTRPGQPVKKRQDAFKSILLSFEPMGKMLRADQYDPDKFATLAAELVQKREAPWPYFGPDTHYPPTKAKAAVWERPADFDKERQSFLAATDELLAAAKTRDQAKVQAAYDKLQASCKSCHRSFRD